MWVGVGVSETLQVTEYVAAAAWASPDTTSRHCQCHRPAPNSLPRDVLGLADRATVASFAPHNPLLFLRGEPAACLLGEVDHDKVGEHSGEDGHQALEDEDPSAQVEGQLMCVRRERCERTSSPSSRRRRP